MARNFSPPLTVLLIALLLHTCLGEQQWQNRAHTRTDCQIDKLTAQEPTLRFDAEAGRTEFWDSNNKQFECARVVAVKNFIQPKGLLQPHYCDAPQLLYVVQGRGIQGTVIPGCPETYESGTEQQSDRHQKVRQIRKGDVIALQDGYILWLYNNGDEPLVTVALVDTGSEINQLDMQVRNFFLAGSSIGKVNRNSILHGFNQESVEEAFNVDSRTARQLRGEDDQRGHIIRTERFNIVLPEEEEEQYYRENGIEETLCTQRQKLNVDSPASADIYNPRGGRISTLNSQKLPILRELGLSAEKGVLYSNAMLAPHWNVNAHSIIYVTRGNGRFQVVGHAGNSVFDGEVREGQMIIVPQNYVVLKKAGEDGLEWIAFKTNDNAVTSQLAGRLSAIRGMPEEVLMNAFGVSREDARNLKYGRDEFRVFSAGSRARSSRAKAFEAAMDAIKSVM